jgi:hypothetical protein
MEELAVRRSRLQISEVRLQLFSTDVPSDALPRGQQGERLLLPTSARILVRDDVLRIEMIAHDPDLWGDRYYVEPDFDDANPPIIVLSLNKDEILRVVVGGRNYNHEPTAELSFRDPLEVVESLSLIFASTDRNNPDYAIKAMAKMLSQRLDIVVEDLRSETLPGGYDEIPF